VVVAPEEPFRDDHARVKPTGPETARPEATRPEATRPEATFDDVLASVRAQLGMSRAHPAPAAELPSPRRVPPSSDVSDWRPRVLTPPASPAQLPAAAPTAATVVAVADPRPSRALQDDRPVSEIVAEIMARVEGTTGLRSGGGDPAWPGDPDPTRAHEAPRADDDPPASGSGSTVDDGTVLDLRSFDLGGRVGTQDDGSGTEDTEDVASSAGRGVTGPDHATSSAAVARAGSELVDRLTALGVPSAMVDAVLADVPPGADPGVAQDLVALALARRLSPGSTPSAVAGDVVVVAGPVPDLVAHGAAVARLLGGGGVPVGCFGDVPGAGEADVLADATAVEARAGAAAAAGMPLVLMLAVEPTLAGARRGARVVRAVGAGTVIGIRSAGHAPAAAARWLDDLAGADTGAGRWLALTGCADTAGAVTAAATTDVLFLDTRPAGRGTWSALLVDALAEPAGRGDGPTG
jgi:hypothetical protein